MTDDVGRSVPGRAAPAQRAAAPEPKPRHKSRTPRAMIITATLVTGLLLGIGGVAAYYTATLRGAADGFAREQVPDYAGRPAAPQPQPDGATARNYVLIGTDKGSVSADDPGRSDALLLAHIPADRSKVYLISIPRDLYADIPGYDKQKITHAYAYGGMGLTVRSVEKLFDVRVDHAASIDFQSFKDLTTALGGIEVDNPQAFQRTRDNVSCNFPKGKITIEGECALTFARERKVLSNGDLDREANHRQVLQGIMRKTMSPETLSNPTRFTQVVDTVSRYVTVDEGYTTDQIVADAMGYRDLALRGDSVVPMQAPISGFGRDPRSNASIAVPDEEKMQELSTALRDDTVGDYAKRYPNQ